MSKNETTPYLEICESYKTKKRVRSDGSVRYEREYYVRLVAANGKILMHSETYTGGRSKAIRAALTLARAISGVADIRLEDGALPRPAMATGLPRFFLNSSLTPSVDDFMYPLKSGEWVSIRHLKERNKQMEMACK